ENPTPLQQFFFRGSQRFHATPNHLRQMFEDAQPVAIHGRFVSLNGVRRSSALTRHEWRVRLGRNLKAFHNDYLGVAREASPAGEPCWHSRLPQGKRKVPLASIKNFGRNRRAAFKK